MRLLTAKSYEGRTGDFMDALKSQYGSLFPHLFKGITAANGTKLTCATCRRSATGCPRIYPSGGCHGAEIGETSRRQEALIFRENGGKVWESNPPRAGSLPATGFEVQAGHQAQSIPALQYHYNT